jgi:hypothetical protein
MAAARHKLAHLLHALRIKSRGGTVIRRSNEDGFSSPLNPTPLRCDRQGLCLHEQGEGK